VRALAVGRRLKALCDDPAARIEDRHTKQVRRLRGADLAVLCPTHSMIAEYAQVLRSLGLRVRVRADGWYASRAVQIACNALSYLANRSDRHAALYLAVTELGSLTLKDALAQLMESGRIAEPAARAARGAGRRSDGPDDLRAHGGHHCGAQAVR